VLHPESVTLHDSNALLASYENIPIVPRAQGASKGKIVVNDGGLDSSFEATLDGADKTA
jgi:hypothetical protein